MALEIVRSDDFVEYFLFPNIGEVSEGEEDDILCETLQQIDAIAKSYAANYIWHKDSFALKKRNRNSHLLNPESQGESCKRRFIDWFRNLFCDVLDQLPAHLHGITYFGDNIQDEWFIVSLLMHLTREVAGLIVRVCDSDGEFLLIEAADHLPEWANPEACEQRVSN